MKQAGSGQESAGTAAAADVEVDGTTPGSSPEEQPTDAAAELGKLTEEESVQSSEGSVQSEDGKPAEGEPEAAEEPEGHRDTKAEKRIGELTAARKSAEEKAAEAEARAKSLEEQANLNLGLHPDLLNPAEAKLIAEANALEDREGFLLRHLGSDYEHPKDPSKSMSAAEIAEELVQVRRKSSTLVPRANALFEARSARQAEALKIGLRILNEREAAKAKGGELRPVKPGVPPAAPPGRIAARPGVSEAPARRGINEKRFEAAGGTRDAAARELSELAGTD